MEQLNIFSNISEVFNYIKKYDIKIVNFKFTNPMNRWVGISFLPKNITNSIFQDGFLIPNYAYDGYSNNGNIRLLPQLNTGFLNPFPSMPTIVFICNTKYEWLDNNVKISSSRDLLLSIIDKHKCDKIDFGFNIQFQIFDEVKQNFSDGEIHSSIISKELIKNNEFVKTEHFIQTGHCTTENTLFMNSQPIDSMHDIRTDISYYLQEMGIKILQHHHSVAYSQNEMSVDFGSCITTADNIQQLKYSVKLCVESHGRTATFMPQVLNTSIGNGITYFISSSNDGYTVDEIYKKILKNLPIIAAFSNASVNSCKRLYLLKKDFSLDDMLQKYMFNGRSCVKFSIPDATGDPYLVLSIIQLSIFEDQFLIPENFDIFNPSLEGLLDILKNNISNKTFSKESLFILEQYINVKNMEINRYKSSVSPHEILEYYSC